MLNTIQLIGRLGKDPEKKETSNQYTYARFSLPLFHGFQKQDKTSWVTCEAWNKLGDLVLDKAKKGSLVYVEGELCMERWEEQGESKSRTYVRVKEYRLLESGKEKAEPEVKTEQEKKTDFLDGMDDLFRDM